MVLESISKCEEGQKELCRSVTLGGGTAMTRNFNTRLQKDLIDVFPLRYGRPRVRVAKEYSAWLGGSVCCRLSCLSSTWITKDEYNEYGERIIHRKQFV